MSELILGALSLLLGYMIIRFVMTLLRKRDNPHDHVIAWSGALRRWMRRWLWT